MEQGISLAFSKVYVALLFHVAMVNYYLLYCLYIRTFPKSLHSGTRMLDRPGLSRLNCIEPSSCRFDWVRGGVQSSSPSQFHSILCIVEGCIISLPMMQSRNRTCPGFPHVRFPVFASFHLNAEAVQNQYQSTGNHSKGSSQNYCSST